MLKNPLGKTFLNQKKSTKAAIVLSILGILTLLVLATLFPFKDKLFSLLYPKPFALAAGGNTYYVATDGFDGNPYNGDVTYANFGSPYGVALVNGNVWITSASNNSIVLLHTNARPLYTTASPITGNGLGGPRSLTTVVNQGTTRVWVVNSGNTISIFNTDGSAYGTPLAGGGLNNPSGIATVTNGSNTYVWVSNSGSNTISVFNTDGTPVGTYSGNGLDVPKGIAVVGSQVWVANYRTNNGNTISRFNPDGTPAGSVILSNNLYGATGILVNGSKVWVSNYNSSISLFNTDGSSAGPNITGNGLSNAYDMTIIPTTAGTFVWVASGVYISFFNLDGTNTTSSCTQINPCLTVNYASSLASGGDTISVAPGTYYGADRIGKSGTSGSPITTQAQGEVIFTWPNPACTACQRNTIFRTANYAVIDGFTFIGMRDRTDWVPGPDMSTENLVELGDYSTLQNSTLQNAEGSGSGGNNGLTFTNDNFINNGITGHYHQIYVTGDSNTVQSSTFSGSAVYGYNIQYYGPGINRFTIRNNNITNAYLAGIVVQNTNGLATTGTISGNFVYKNGWGISAPGGTTITNNIIANNTFNPSVGIYNADTTLKSILRTLGVNAYEAAVVSNQIWVTNMFNNTISRLNTDGTSAGANISGNGLSGPEGIALIGSQVWVANSRNNTISRFNTDGTAAGIPISGNGLSSPAGIAVVGSQVWVTSSNCAKISRFYTDGSAIDNFSPATFHGCFNGGIVPVVSGGTTTVWVTTTNANIDRYNTDGSQISSITIAGAGDYLNGVANVGSEVWVADSNNATVYRLNTGGIVLGTINVWGATRITPVGTAVWITLQGAAGANFTYGTGIVINNDLGASAIYNNTLYQDGYKEISTASTNSIIKNNLIVGDSSNTTGDTALYNSNTGTSADYNLYYNVTVASNSISGGSRSLISNPLLVNPAAAPSVAANFALQSSSPAIDTGTDLTSALTVDYAGTTRPQGLAFDIGAYEYIPTAPSPTPTPPSLTGNITGAVYSSLGGVISGAKVSLTVNGLKQTYLTNSQGVYNIPNLNPGSYTLKYQALGYNPNQTTVQVVANQTLTADITLVASKKKL